MIVLHDRNCGNRQAEELTALIYGSIVSEVLTTCENMTEANHRLEKIGHRIGTKIVDEFMKDAGKPCTKIAELVDRFATTGVRKFLGADSRHQDYKLTEKGFSFNLKISNNPLLKNLEVLGDLKTGGLQYQSLIRGSIKGAFEVLRFKVDVLLLFESLRADKNDTIFFIDASRL